MLVLSRKTNQSIMIGDAIRVIVVGFDGDQVKLGIEAPRDVPVHRSRFLRRFTKPFFGRACERLGRRGHAPEPVEC